MEATTTVITVEQALEKLKAEYPRGVELYYVDYRDDLSGNKNVLQEILETGYTDVDIFEYRDTRESIDQARKCTFTAEELEYIENHNDIDEAIRDWFYENDKSEPMKDLIRNTNDQLCLVDLNFHFDDYTGTSQEEREETCKEFLKHIGQEPTENNVKQVHSIYIEAYYGGTAYAMIQADLSDFYANTSNHISITDLKLGIIDTYNGSGDYGDVDTIKDIVKPRTDIVLDSLIGYGVNSIFGGGIQGSDGYELKQIDGVVVDTEPSQIKKDIAEEEQWKKDYAKNKCAGFGCHKFKYHTTEYRNDYPCGNKCIHCGRFFID